jgi:cell division protein FtsB
MSDPIKRTEKSPTPPPSPFLSARALIFCAAVIALFGIFYLGQSSQTTLTGQRTHDLQAQLDRIERENIQLQIEIAELTAPAKLAERARLMGMRPAVETQVHYIIVRNYPVENPKPAPVWSPHPRADFWTRTLERFGLAPGSGAVEASP